MNIHQKNLVRLFDSLCGAHSRWAVWSDFITLTAISINITVDRIHAEERVKTYKTIASKYTEKEIAVFAQMFDEIVNGMENAPDQDFLGELFMGLELGNDHAGQFFTPYCVCKAMAEMTVPDIKQMVESKGWFGCCDPACGAGALLVAFANTCLDRDVNYQTSVLFVAQDIDYIVGMMCYIQLSLLGCAGYVVIGDSLLNPTVSIDRRSLIPVDKGNVWYMPMYFLDIWAYRCIYAQMDIFLHKRFEETFAQIMPQVEKPVEAVNKPQFQAQKDAKTKEPFSETKNGQLSFF